jgi:transposase
LIGKKVKNPGITKFNLSSYFIYDMSRPSEYILSIKNKNTIKLNEKEHDKLVNEINRINNFFDKDEIGTILSLTLDEINCINKYFKVITKEKDEVDWAKNFFKNNPKNDNISCSKLAQLYKEQTGKIIGRTKMYYILKNKLNLKYRRTTIKNKKLISNESIFSSLCFIKIFTRAIILGFDILFLDETAILLKNNHFKCWRNDDEKLYHKIGPNSKTNLLLIVSKNEVVHFQLNREETNQDKFFNFLNGFFQKIKSNVSNKFIVVLDNLSAHKTSKIINFFKEKNINVLFNTPYLSEFNAIELAFRYLKKILYSKIFDTIEEVEAKVINILKSDKLKETLLKNYRETLEVYMKYSSEYKYKNLNNLVFDS